jgi:thiamine biosynthesis lipoprotein
MIVLAKIKRKIIQEEAHIIMGFFFLWISCTTPNEYNFMSGSTMGTTYSIKISTEAENVIYDGLKSSIDSILIDLNSTLSTWDTESDISLFNNSTSMKPILLSKTFNTVIKKSIDISKQTNGFFDITVYDLMSLWGFGPEPSLKVPNKKNIDSILVYTNFKKIRLKDQKLSKLHPSLKIDLNAIAKGYGVDQVFNFLNKKGIKNIFVEIGGEVRCKGLNPKGYFWLVGLDNPDKKDKNDLFFSLIELDNIAIATSGNYRNFVDLNGENLGHTINPKTGFPVKSNVLSVTVLSKSCMVADAWATALMVMDYDTGFNSVKKTEHLSVIWLIEKDEKRIIKKYGNIKINEALYSIGA